MAKEHLIMWKAIEKGWSSSDLKRIKKKIYELWKDFNCSIPFEDAESLCYLLGEPISYKTEWSLIRLCKDGIIDIFEKDELSPSGRTTLHYIDLIEFNSPSRDVRTRKQKSAKHVSPVAKEGDINTDGQLSF